jgi:hypothetical protein
MVGLAVALVFMLGLSLSWLWYTRLRTMRTFERAVEYVEHRHLHRVLRIVLDHLETLARTVQTSAKELLERAELARTAFAQTVQPASTAAEPPNRNRRFPAERVDALLLPVQSELETRVFSAFHTAHQHDLTHQGTPWMGWNRTLHEAAQATATQHLSGLSYDDFARAAGLNGAARDRIIRDLVAQSANGLWLRAVAPNPRPWVIIPPTWREQQAIQDTQAAVVACSTPVLAALTLIELRRAVHGNPRPLS